VIVHQLSQVTLCSSRNGILTFEVGFKIMCEDEAEKFFMEHERIHTDPGGKRERRLRSGV